MEVKRLVRAVPTCCMEDTAASAMRATTNAYSTMSCPSSWLRSSWSFKNSLSSRFFIVIPRQVDFPSPTLGTYHSWNRCADFANARVRAPQESGKDEPKGENPPSTRDCGKGTSYDASGSQKTVSKSSCNQGNEQPGPRPGTQSQEAVLRFQTRVEKTRESARWQTLPRFALVLRCATPPKGNQMVSGPNPYGRD